MAVWIVVGVTLGVAFGVAYAQRDTGKTWDFQGDALSSPPSGFTFGRTGQGREGKWVVLADASAPSGDHVLAQTDTDPTDYRFPVAFANAPELKDLRRTRGTTSPSRRTAIGFRPSGRASRSSTRRTTRSARRARSACGRRRIPSPTSTR